MLHPLQKLKISIVIPSFYPAFVYGGTITSSLMTSQQLAELGHEVEVITTNTNMHNYLDVETNKFVQFASNLRVKYYHDTILDRFSLPMFINLKKDLKKADVVHIQSIFNSPTPWALYLSLQLKKPVLLSPRGVLNDWIIGQGIPFKKLWLKYFIRPFAHKVYWHTTAEQEKKEVLRHFPQARVIVIPNGIDLEEFQQLTTSSNEQSWFKKYLNKDISVGPVIVSMGRVHKKKGFDVLINAFQQILSVHPGAHLFIAGQNEGEQENLLALAKSLNILDKVHFTGQINGNEKLNFLSKADLFVLPSHNENFGNVYAEALAAGTPIIASKNTPWMEVEQFNCGRWVDNSIDSTSEAMLDLLSQDLTVMGDNGREYIKRFSWQAIGKQFDELFNQMINGKK